MKQLLFVFLVFCSCFGQVVAQPQRYSKNLTTFIIEDSLHHKSRKIWLYTPVNYAASKKKYPVIYLQDGQNLFDAQSSFAGEWNLDEKLDSLKAQVIAVGIENDGVNRLHEYTPYVNPTYGGGGATEYLQFVIQHIKPYIDKHYRSKPDPKHTMIMGSSLGGLVSLYAVMKYPETFGKAGVFSPSLWFSDQIYTDLKALPEFKAKVYLLCGDHESESMVADIKRLEININEKRCYCMHLNKLTLVPGGQHNEKLWRDAFVKAYLWLL